MRSIESYNQINKNTRKSVKEDITSDLWYLTSVMNKNLSTINNRYIL